MFEVFYKRWEDLPMRRLLDENNPLISLRYMRVICNMQLVTNPVTSDETTNRWLTAPIPHATHYSADETRQYPTKRNRLHSRRHGRSERRRHNRQTLRTVDHTLLDIVELHSQSDEEHTSHLTRLGTAWQVSGWTGVTAPFNRWINGMGCRRCKCQRLGEKI